MDCKQARPLIDADVDRELPPADAERLAQHLAQCADCRHESEAIRALGHAVRQTPYFRAPEDLRASILAALPGEAANSPDTSGISDAPPRQWQRPSYWARWREWIDRLGSRTRSAARGTPGPLAPAGMPAFGLGALASMTAAACAVAVVATLAVTSLGPARNDAFVDELVASHVRAELSGRDIDVVSTDQHTVKPWFNGRLDYAPPVEDLAAAGFTLTGGRLDYVGHRRIGVLIYRYRKHVLDVYVFPGDDRAAAAPPDRLARDGYALARWHDRGMTWWGVTDAAPEVLAKFEAALKAQQQDRD
ncbi:anti-sigma factor family protein [Trinickia fusca]|uniref:Anti-sigma factor n=1 Tax=Trinickia fusca TaxID=2419777 RepID=A0A494XTM5_9BURK|nr:anti-sigma factor [Trinickia fusca]RKP50883.1 anti-sigma factor [Trinickia fusca]